MGYRVNYETMNGILDRLKENYHVYAPAWVQRKKKVRYREISRIEDIVLDRQSDFSPKEIYYPISQTMFYFTDTDVRDSEFTDEKEVLIFARACDINGIARLDHIFLENGGHGDLFYKRLRERVKFVLLECTESFENCFCVSVGSSKAENYSAAVRIGADEVLAEVKDDSLADYFAGNEKVDYTPEFVTENRKKIRIPRIPERSMLKTISGLEYWNQFDERCIGCGGCNTVCGTCSCFDTIDVIYKEGSREGERRRAWSSCMLENFTETAGGGRARKTPGANMRFKVFHKFYDYNVRFGGDGHMCVGCGRCDIRCPKQISFFDAVDGLSDEIDKINAGKEDA